MRSIFSALTLLSITLSGAQLNPAAGVPPVAKKIPSVTKLHGLELVDNYAWLKNKTSKDTINYLKAENAYTDKVMAPTKRLQESLYQEMLGRIQEDDQDVPIFDRGYWYYTRTAKGKEYGIHCRKTSMAGREEIFLDENKLAKGKKFFDLGEVAISPNGKLLACTTDTTGFREYQLTIKDLVSGKNLKDKIGKVLQVEWATDNKTIFYVTEDAAKRWNKVWRYKLGSGKSELVYEETDEIYNLAIGGTTDRRYLILESGSKDANELRILDLRKPTSEPTIIQPRKDNLLYSMDHRNGLLYITTNDKGSNFRVVTAPVGNPAQENWKELIPERPETVINGVLTFRDFMVISVRSGGFTQLHVKSYETGKRFALPMADPVADIGLYRNPEYNTKSINYAYQSLTTPGSIYRFDVRSRKSVVLKQNKVKGGYKPSDYVSELQWAAATDGTKIPISIVRKKTTSLTKPNPLMLFAYGSYGASTDPWFSIGRLNLLNRGMIFAIAHIRGGGEFGRKWYEDGKMFNKMNTFTDFIDCGDYLVKKGYTKHTMMAMNGGSAGGLLMGAVLNMRPDLVKACIADVPFVDVINTMLDESLPLTVGEFIEWGNPKVKEQYEYMAQYSPYDNIKAQPYPDLLITTSLNDSQVLYHEPAKWCAKLRALKTSKNVLMLRCNMDAGHGGASGRYSSLRETAIDQAFILSQLGLANR
ncbi:MAG: S9 family peptidase [Fimbriimonadaceae bacterium]